MFNEVVELRNDCCMSRKITGRLICEALDIAPSAVDCLIRDYAFRPLDPQSNAPGRARDWSRSDVLRVCLALRLLDLGLGRLDACAEVPPLSDLAPDSWIVVDIFDASPNGCAPAPADVRIRMVASSDLVPCAFHCAPQALVLKASIILADAERVMRLARGA